MAQHDGEAARADTRHSATAGSTFDARPVPADRPGAAASPRPGRGSAVASALLIVGGLAAGTLAAGALSSEPRYEMAQVDAADLDAAAQSIPPAEAATHVAEAKACRTPMAVVTLRARPGQAGTVRIRSGDYWSPSVRLGNEPLRVAIPYPAPYQTGLGELAFESNGMDYDAFLRPGWISAGRQGLSLLHVWWTPKQPC